jgi:predicted nucleic acid-binding protein
MAFVVVYDACVLYPSHLRDLLIRLANSGLVQAKWSEAIIDEAMSAILRTRPHLADKLKRTRDLLLDAVPDCLISGHEALVDALELPDPEDRHVLAAAIRAHAQVIVTQNVKDFPRDALEPYAIEAQSPDEFVLNLLDLWRPTVDRVIDQMVSVLTQPPVDRDQLLSILARDGLPQTAALLREDAVGPAPPDGDGQS